MLGKHDLLDELRTSAEQCEQCPLHCYRKKVVFGEGSPYADLMFIGEAPGEWEDATGEPFVGRAGQLLASVIRALGYDRKDVYIANIVKCRPPVNRDPLPPEIEACSGYINDQIRVVEPKVIVTLGRVATQALLQETTGITELRGEWKKVKPLSWVEIDVMPTFHPAYVLRNPEAKEALREDMMKVKQRLEEVKSRVSSGDEEKAQETVQANG